MRFDLPMDTHIEDDKVRYQIVFKGASDMSVPVEPKDDTNAGWLIVLPIAAGLLALFFFLSLGGLFAVLAPWVILAGIQSAMKRSGWQLLGIFTGLAFMGMGAAVLLLPGHVSLSGSVAAVMGLLGGAGYIGFTLWQIGK